jgi:hypothetical protein
MELPKGAAECSFTTGAPPPPPPPGVSYAVLLDMKAHQLCQWHCLNTAWL